MGQPRRGGTWRASEPPRRGLARKEKGDKAGRAVAELCREAMTARHARREGAVMWSRAGRAVSSWKGEKAWGRRRTEERGCAADRKDRAVSGKVRRLALASWAVRAAQGEVEGAGWAGWLAGRAGASACGSARAREAGRAKAIGAGQLSGSGRRKG